jgi:hypothetical protein
MPIIVVQSGLHVWLAGAQEIIFVQSPHATKIDRGAPGDPRGVY